jgi:23S rRNA-/tRNA-specific pseudouridylate synthase
MAAAGCLSGSSSSCAARGRWRSSSNWPIASTARPSGLLVVAKKRVALTRLHDMFRDGGINKRYLALVKGRWRNELQHVKLPLHKYLTAEGERRVSVNAEGKAAHSIVRLVARWENFSLVEVELKTGRTHQIRVHLSHLGFPIAGDDKYGDFPLNKDLQKSRTQTHVPPCGEAGAAASAVRGAGGTRVAAAG